MSAADADVGCVLPSAADDDDEDVGCLYRSLWAPAAAGSVWTPVSIRFHTKTVLRAVTALLFCGMLAVTIVLAVNDAYNMGMFTLWSWTITMAFLLVFLVSLWVQHLLLTWTLLALFPVVLSNVMFVAIAIVIIIANDSTVLTNDTPCATPPPADPKYTMSQVHTGDWVEHGVPPLAVYLVLIAGGLAIIRTVLAIFLNSLNPLLQILYFLYWMCGTLVLLGIYDLAFDIAKTYPTSFTTAERVLILLAIVLLWQLAMWIIFTSVDVAGDLKLVVPATPEEFMETGSLAGSGKPSSQHARLLVPTTEELLNIPQGGLLELIDADGVWRDGERFSL